jgi:hypothetical protein
MVASITRVQSPLNFLLNLVVNMTIVAESVRYENPHYVIFPEVLGFFISLRHKYVHQHIAFNPLVPVSHRPTSTTEPAVNK